jgi:hypothetical protein
MVGCKPKEHQEELREVFQKYKKKYGRTFSEIEILLMMIVDERKEQKTQFGLIH